MPAKIDLVRRFVAAIALTAAMAGGCSFVLVRGPTEPTHRSEEPRCTWNPAAPIIDTVVTGALAANAVHTQLEINDRGPPPVDGDHTGDRKVLGWERDLSILTGLVFAASAAYGYVRTAKCREVLAARAAPK